MVQPSRQESSAVSPSEDRLVGSDRVLAVLIELAGHADGVGLDELARAMGSAKSTVHRALAALKRAGFAEQDSRGSYLLGDEFLRLAFSHHELRPDHIRVRPALEELSQHFGETVHYAVLSGRSVVYRSKVDPPAGAVQLTSVVGGRNPAYCTAVGKLLLSYALHDDQAVLDWVGDAELPRRTDRTITTADGLCEELREIRRQGYSVDDQENETGVNCVALPVFLTSPSVPSGAISVSGLSYRTPLDTLVGEVGTIGAIIAALSSRGVARERQEPQP